MNNLKFVLTFLMILAFLGAMIGYVSAVDIPEYNRNSNVRLVTICDNCSNVNLTNVRYPDGSFALIGDYPMVSNGTSYYYDFNNTNVLGIYSYVTCGDLNGVTTCKDTSSIDGELRQFKVVPTGFTLLFDLDNPISIGIIVVLLLASLLLFIFNNYMYSALALLLVGFILLFNKVNLIISIAVILIAVVITFKK